MTSAQKTEIREEKNRARIREFQLRYRAKQIAKDREGFLRRKAEINLKWRASLKEKDSKAFYRREAERVRRWRQKEKEEHPERYGKYATSESGRRYARARRRVNKAAKLGTKPLEAKSTETLPEVEDGAADDHVRPEKQGAKRRQRQKISNQSQSEHTGLRIVVSSRRARSRQKTLAPHKRRDIDARLQPHAKRFTGKSSTAISSENNLRLRRRAQKRSRYTDAERKAARRETWQRYNAKRRKKSKDGHKNVHAERSRQYRARLLAEDRDAYRKRIRERERRYTARRRTEGGEKYMSKRRETVRRSLAKLKAKDPVEYRKSHAERQRRARRKEREMHPEQYGKYKTTKRHRQASKAYNKSKRDRRQRTAARVAEGVADACSDISCRQPSEENEGPSRPAPEHTGLRIILPSPKK